MENKKIMEKIKALKNVREEMITGYPAFVSDEVIVIETNKKIFLGFGIVVFPQEIRLVNVTEVKIYSINEKDIIDIREWGIKNGK